MMRLNFIDMLSCFRRTDRQISQSSTVNFVASVYGTTDPVTDSLVSA